MIHFPHWFPVHLLRPMGWTLVHSLWQILLVVGLYQAFVLATRNRSPRLRYVVGCVALVMCLAAPLGTFVTLARPPAETTGPARATAPTDVAARAGANDTTSTAPVAHHGGAHDHASGTSDHAGAATPGLDPVTWAASTADAQVIWLVPLWSAGALIGLLLLLNAWRAAARLATHGAAPARPDLQAAMERLRTRLGVRRAPRLVESDAVDSPALVGWLRPTILLPRTAAALDRAEVEPLIAHELAHVRRGDYLSGLVQNAIGRLLFFHPGVHWLLRRLRVEREACCDDLAARCCAGGPLAYARALTRLEAARPRVPLLGAGEGDLFARIRRLVDHSGAARPRPVLALLLVLACLGTAGFSYDLLARSQAATVIDGLDPVLLLAGESVHGSAALAVEHDGYRYLFASADTRARFLADTDRYRVRNVAFCPVSGRRALPHVYRVIDGNILLFCCPEVGGGDQSLARAYLDSLPAPTDPAPTD